MSTYFNPGPRYSPLNETAGPRPLRQPTPVSSIANISPVIIEPRTYNERADDIAGQPITRGLLELVEQLIGEIRRDIDHRREACMTEDESVALAKLYDYRQQCFRAVAE